MCAKDVDLETFTGLCPSCGNKMEIPLKINTILGIDAPCSKCFNTVYFNLYSHERFRSHRDKLRVSLAGKEKVAVFGVGINGRLLQFYDVMGLNPDKICCYVDEACSWKGRYFFNHEVVSPIELKSKNPDFILVADSFSLRQTKYNLRKLGLDASRIDGVMPHDWLQFVKEMYG